MHRTAFAKRRAGYKRVLRQYQSLGYLDAEIDFSGAGSFPARTPMGVNNNPRTAHYAGTYTPRHHASDMVRAMSRVALAASQSESAMAVFGDAVAKTAQKMAEFLPSAEELAVQKFAEEILLAERLATEILDEADRGYAPRARQRAGLDRSFRLKRQTLAGFWAWLQDRVTRGGYQVTLPVPAIVAQALEEQ